jgi:hypothetical protein
MEKNEIDLNFIVYQKKKRGRGKAIRCCSFSHLQKMFISFKKKHKKFKKIENKK